MLLAITSKEWGLAVVAAIFIAFAVLASFVFPRRSPDFPGPRLPIFLAATIVLFVGMVTAVFVFAGEEGGDDHEAGVTETEATATTGGATTQAEGAGDPAAGESVFASSGCGSCHTLEAAGATGGVGPNLDDSQPAFELVVERVTNGSGAMPPFKGQLLEEQIRDVAAYVVEASS